MRAATEEATARGRTTIISAGARVATTPGGHFAGDFADRIMPPSCAASSLEEAKVPIRSGAQSSFDAHTLGSQT